MEKRGCEILVPRHGVLAEMYREAGPVCMIDSGVLNVSCFLCSISSGLEENGTPVYQKLEIEFLCTQVDYHTDGTKINYDGISFC